MTNVISISDIFQNNILGKNHDMCLLKTGEDIIARSRQNSNCAYNNCALIACVAQVVEKILSFFFIFYGTKTF